MILNALKSKKVSKLLIATSNNRSDDELVNFLKKKILMYLEEVLVT